MDYPSYVIRAIALYRDELEKMKYGNEPHYHIEKLVCITSDFDRSLKLSGLTIGETISLFAIPAMERDGKTEFSEDALESYDRAIRKMSYFMNTGRVLHA